MRNKISDFMHDAKSILLISSFVVIPLGLWVGFSALEANAYNKATNSNVSTWQAMFIELRVQGDTPTNK